MGIDSIIIILMLAALIALMVLFLSRQTKANARAMERLRADVEKVSREAYRELDEALQNSMYMLRRELAENQKLMGETLSRTLGEKLDQTNRGIFDMSRQMETRLGTFSKENEQKLQNIRETIERQLASLQQENSKKLDEMRNVVDEKLQKTLETRLAQSFELVSKQLDSVQQGLGEMKNLAADAKSLKNALTNVKERGTYGEVRLEKLLSDILAPNQYDTNVEISNNKRVEFVIKLPGSGDTPLLLPIDSKFPIEDYNRLIDAQDKAEIDEARKSLAKTIRDSARDIYEKYIVPPKTTDFALMFLPTEGLYAEVVLNAALFEELRDKYRVTAIGATTLSAFLSSLQMGFKTLAIEQRSQEVWDTLRAVKSEFVKFGGILDTAHKQIQTVDKTLEEIVGRRTRAINKTLRSVEELGGTIDPILIEAADEEDDA